MGITPHRPEIALNLRLRRNRLFGFIGAIILIPIVSGLAAVSTTIVLYDAAQYPYFGADLRSLGGGLGFMAGLTIGAILGALLLSSLIYFRFISDDAYEALTVWKPSTRSIFYWFLGICLGLPLAAKIAVANIESHTWYYNRVVDVASVVQWFDKHAGGLAGFVISALSIVAFSLTVLQLRDFQSRISSFSQLMEELVKLANEATPHDRMHVICYTPAIGYLAEQRLWESVRLALTRETIENGVCYPNVRLLVPHIKEVNEWHEAFLGRRRKRRAENAAIIGIEDIQNANAAAQAVRNTLFNANAYDEVSFDVLPGYYCFFTNKRAIVVNPLFVPLVADSKARSSMPSSYPPPDMVGYSTNEKGIIDHLFAQFEHILEVNSNLKSSAPNSIAEFSSPGIMPTTRA